MLPPSSPHPQNSRNSKVTKTNKQTNESKAPTVAPELVTYTCVTDAKHSVLPQLIVDWLGLYVRSPILKDLTKIGKPPCNVSHEN